VYGEWMMIQFWVPGNPVPKQSFRYKKSGSYQPKRVKDWQEAVGWMALSATSGEVLERDVRVELNFKRKDKRKVDLDNLSKAVLDACNGVVWADDRQIVTLYLTKEYDPADPGVLVSIW